MFVKRSYRNIARRLGLEECVPLGQVLFSGFDKVELVESKTRMNISLEAQKMIEGVWGDHLKKNPNDFDGDLGSIISLFECPSGTLNIEFHEGKFSQLYAMSLIKKKKIDVKSFPLDLGRCLALSFGAVALTADNYIIFAERGQTAFDAETITLLPGGYFNPKTDFFTGEKSNRMIKTHSIGITILRELFEETGIFLSCLKVNYLGLVYNKQGSSQPLLACYINLPYTSEEIKSKMSLDEESTKVFFVKNSIDAVAQFVFKKNVAIHDAWKLILYFYKMLNN
jgi:hypothetical protein